MKKIFFFFLMGLLSMPMFAQLTIDAQIRPRAEFRNGYKTLPKIDDSHAFSISQRSRISTTFNNENIELFFSIQDIRTWGEEELLKDNPGSAVHEAWAKIKFNDNYALKLGRQEIILDDQRFFGNIGWEQQALSHDAAVLKYNKNGWKAQLGGAYNQEQVALFGTGYDLESYKILAYLWFGKTLFDNLKLSVLAVNDGVQAQDTTLNVLHRQTAGINLGYKAGNFGLDGSFFLQAGQHIDYSDISAYLAAVSAFYKIGKIKLSAGYELISGKDATDANDTKYRAFHTLFGTNHKFYGLMDYFLNIPKNTKQGGLQDIMVKLNWEVCNSLNMGIHYHNFALANNSPAIINPTQLPKGLGSEIDFMGLYRLSDDVKIHFGYSTMLATETMEAIKGGIADNMGHWGWVMIDINPSIFTSAKKQGE